MPSYQEAAVGNELAVLCIELVLLLLKFNIHRIPGSECIVYHRNDKLGHPADDGAIHIIKYR